LKKAVNNYTITAYEWLAQAKNGNGAKRNESVLWWNMLSVRSRKSLHSQNKAHYGEIYFWFRAYEGIKLARKSS